MFKSDVVKDRTDMRHMTWKKGRESSGTTGTLLKSSFTDKEGTKHYYKLSDYSVTEGIIGHECVNELVCSRLLTILGVDYLSYRLLHALISVDGKEFDTWIAESLDFKKPGQSKMALDDYYEMNMFPEETPFDFCVRMGWQEEICQMLVVDYLILNRDRHGANIEVLKNSAGEHMLAPLFDHGLSLVYDCRTERAAAAFDVLDDWPVQSFFGGHSAEKNLQFIKKENIPSLRSPEKRDKEVLFKGLSGILPDIYYEKMWEMIEKRWRHYDRFIKDLRNS